MLISTSEKADQMSKVYCYYSFAFSVAHPIKGAAALLASMASVIAATRGAQKSSATSADAVANRN